MSTDKTARHTYVVKGLDCADCALQVEKAVVRLPGVKMAEVIFATGKLTVTGHPTLDMESIQKSVGALGYDLAETSELESASLYVEGMDCADEAVIIEKKLGAVLGIHQVVTYAPVSRVTVSYDPRATSLQSIVRAIAETGMAARLERRTTQTKPWWAEPRIILLALSGFTSLAAFTLASLGVPTPLAQTLYGVAILFGAYYPAKVGLAGLRSWHLNIDTLLVVASAGAIVLGLLEEAAVLVFVYSLGLVLEAYAVDRARGSIRALMELVPREAVVRRSGSEMALPVEQIELGEIVIVRPGEKIPLDGTVAAGASSVDQAPITGESVPVHKAQGEPVFAGTINGNGALEVRVAKRASETTLAKIIHSVEEAQAKKSRYQRFGDTFGRYYTPAIFGLAALTAVVPALVLGEPFTPWFYRSLVLLVVSCSCGLALSVPIAVVAAISSAARNGVLIKGGAYLETAAGVRAILLDKTGTVTIGRPRVTDVVPLDKVSADEVLSLAGAIEARSQHPLAEAILSEARMRGLELPEVADFSSIPGQGVSAKIDGSTYHLGGRQLFRNRLQEGTEREDWTSTLARFEKYGKTAVLLAREETALGMIAVRDELRENVPNTVRRLKEIGVQKVVMLTGDNEKVAAAMAEAAGVNRYFAELLPEDKVRLVERLKGELGQVMMIGDGVNDAPALATADVGIAMGAAGTDVAIETADVVLMSDDLSRVPYVLELSKRSIANVKQNIAVSLAIVAILVPAAIAGRIDLVPGLLINEISALIVMANGLRLLR